MRDNPFPRHLFLLRPTKQNAHQLKEYSLALANDKIQMFYLFDLQLVGKLVTHVLGESLNEPKVVVSFPDMVMCSAC